MSSFAAPLRLARLACLALPAAACAGPARPAAQVTRAEDLVVMTADDVRALARAEKKAVHVALWATWCDPCLAEMATLTAFQAAHPEVVVLGLATEDPDIPSAARRMVKVLSEKRPGYLQARLAPGGEGDFLAAFGTAWDGMLPKLVIVPAGAE